MMSFTTSDANELPLYLQNNLYVIKCEKEVYLPGEIIKGVFTMVVIQDMPCKNAYIKLHSDLLTCVTFTTESKNKRCYNRAVDVRPKTNISIKIASFPSEYLAAGTYPFEFQFELPKDTTSSFDSFQGVSMMPLPPDQINMAAHDTSLKVYLDGCGDSAIEKQLLYKVHAQGLKVVDRPQGLSGMCWGIEEKVLSGFDKKGQISIKATLARPALQPGQNKILLEVKNETSFKISKIYGNLRREHHISSKGKNKIKTLVVATCDIAGMSENSCFGFGVEPPRELSFFLNSSRHQGVASSEQFCYLPVHDMDGSIVKYQLQIKVKTEGKTTSNVTLDIKNIDARQPYVEPYLLNKEPENYTQILQQSQPQLG